MHTQDKMDSFVCGLIEKAEKSLNKVLDGCKDDNYQLEMLRAYMPIIEALASVTAKINQ